MSECSAIQVVIAIDRSAFSPFSVNQSTLEPDFSDYYEDPDAVTVRNESLPPYSIVFYVSLCLFWNQTSETWAKDGCEVWDSFRAFSL